MIISTVTECDVTVVSVFGIYVEICDAWRYSACFCSRRSCGWLPEIEPSKQQLVTEKDMHQLMIGLLVIFFLGDAGRQMLAWPGVVDHQQLA